MCSPTSSWSPIRIDPGSSTGHCPAARLSWSATRSSGRSRTPASLFRRSPAIASVCRRQVQQNHACRGEWYTTLETKVNFVRPVTMDTGQVFILGLNAVAIGVQLLPVMHHLSWSDHAGRVALQQREWSELPTCARSFRRSCAQPREQPGHRFRPRPTRLDVG
jgi:hypothetical protein